MDRPDSRGQTLALPSCPRRRLHAAFPVHLVAPPAQQARCAARAPGPSLFAEPPVAAALQLGPLEPRPFPSFARRGAWPVLADAAQATRFLAQSAGAPPPNPPTGLYTARAPPPSATDGPRAC